MIQQNSEHEIAESSRDDTTEESAGEIRSRVYTAAPLGHPLRISLAIVADIWRNRELTQILFVRDLKAQFRQSLLGYVWLVLPPLVAALIWYLMNSQRMINVETGAVPYPVFVLIGSTLWASFSAMVTAPSDAVSNNREVLVKLNVPIEPFILAGAGRAIANLIVSSIVVLPILIAAGASIKWTAVFYPVCALMFLVSGFAIGMLIAPFGALYTDFRSAMTPILQVLMFTVPVIFPIPETDGVFTSVMRHNPITPALALTRDSIVSGGSDWLAESLLWFVVFLLLINATFVVFRIAKPHLIARMGM